MVINLIYFFLKFIIIIVIFCLDHWVPPPDNDNRRTPGMKYMNATGQANINYDTLLNVLTLDPVCNK
jgi:hypothetical protein